MPGRFHELSIATADIRASIDFYESLGFWQAPTGDAWSHPYGVVTDGRVVLGLHQAPDFSAITFIHPDLTAVADGLLAAGVALSLRHTNPEVFNRLEFMDPAGQKIRMLAARTFSPADRPEKGNSHLGYFAHYSMPARDPPPVAGFWEALGFVAMPQAQEPYVHQSLTSDGIDLALHSPRLLPAPVLVFCEEDMEVRISRLRQLGVAFDPALPRELAAAGNALLEAPEGTLLLLLTGSV
jgi:catechol 2,3-dioxygenase-like lactoylglutathione lyase family enzyme